MEDVKLYGTVFGVDRRRRYLTVALAQFAEHGFNGVTMDQVVAAAGGSKATLYRYFPSKDSLFESIIADIVESTAPSDGAEDWSTVDLETGLRLLGRAIAAAALDERTIVMLRLAAGEQSRFPQLGLTLFELGPARSYARMRGFLADMLARGDIEGIDLQVAAEQFLGGIVGHQQMRLALGLEPPSAAAIELRIETAVRDFVAVHAIR